MHQSTRIQMKTVKTIQVTQKNGGKILSNQCERILKYCLEMPKTWISLQNISWKRFKLLKIMAPAAKFCQIKVKECWSIAVENAHKLACKKITWKRFRWLRRMSPPAKLCQIDVKEKNVEVLLLKMPKSWIMYVACKKKLRENDSGESEEWWRSWSIGCHLHSVEIWIFFLPRFFCKNFVKVTFLLKNYTVNWFHENFLKWGVNFRHYHTVICKERKSVKL